MTTDQGPTNDLTAIWLNQLKPTVTLTREDLIATSERFEKRLMRIMVREYSACAIVIALAIWYAIFGPARSWLTQASAVALILGVAYVAWGLHQRMPSRVSSSVAAGMPLLDFQKEQLTAWRNALKSVWHWYILPLLPCVSLVMIDRWFFGIEEGIPVDAHRQAVILASAICVLAFIAVWLFNLLGAARLQRQIDHLEHFRKQ